MNQLRFPARSAIALALLLVAGGCTWSGSYGPYSYLLRNDSGYRDTQVAANQWLVSYQGNTMSHPTRVVDFTLLRAAELSRDAGFHYFQIIGVSDGTRVSSFMTPGSMTATTSATASCIGDAAVLCTGTGTTVYTQVPPAIYQFVRPGLTIHVIATQEEPDGGAAFDANLIWQVVRNQYGLR